MHATLLIELLDRLEEEAWTELRDFLKHPQAAVTPKALALFARLYDLRTEWKQTEIRQAVLERESLYAWIYPGEAFKDQRLRRVWMELQKGIKAWIRFRSLTEEHWMQRELTWLQYLLDLRLYDRFPKAFRAVQRRLEKDPSDHPDLQLYVSRLYQIETEFLIHSQAAKDQLEQVDRALDRFYLAQKLEIWASVTTREKRYPQEHHLGFLPELEVILEKAPVDQWPEVQLWNQVRKLEAPGATGREYQNLETTLRQHRELLPLVKLRQVRGYMFNFLNRRIQTDRREDYRTCWQLIVTMREEGTLHLQGRLSEAFLRVAIRSACFAGEVEWAAEFLEAEAGNLVGKSREQVLAAMRVLVGVYQERYRWVIREVLMMRYGDSRVEILLRICELKALYALEVGEDLILKAESLRKLLYRKTELSERIREAHLSFVTWVLYLGRHRWEGQLGADVVEKIRASEASEKLWLLEQCASLGND